MGSLLILLKTERVTSSKTAAEYIRSQQTDGGSKPAVHENFTAQHSDASMPSEAFGSSRRISAVHDEAARAEDTDCPQILVLYELLKRMSDNPVITLNHRSEERRVGKECRSR